MTVVPLTPHPTTARRVGASVPLGLQASCQSGICSTMRLPAIVCWTLLAACSSQRQDSIPAAVDAVTIDANRQVGPTDGSAGDTPDGTAPIAAECPLRRMQVPGVDAHFTPMYRTAAFGEDLGLAVISQLPPDAFDGFFRPYIVQYYRISTADWQWHTQAVAYSGETEPSMLPTGIRIGPNGSMLGTVVGGAKGPKVCHWSGVGLPSCATYSAEPASSSSAMVLAEVDWTQGTATGWRREKSANQVVTATLWPILIKFSATSSVSIAPAAGPSVTVADDNHLSSIMPLSTGVLTISTLPQSEALLMRRYSDQGKLLWQAAVDSGPKRASRPLVDETNARVVWLVTDSVDGSKALLREYDLAIGALLKSTGIAVATVEPDWLDVCLAALPGTDVALAYTQFVSSSGQHDAGFAWLSKQNRLVGKRVIVHPPGPLPARYMPHAGRPLLWWLADSPTEVVIGLADLWGNATCESSGPCWQKTYADCADPNPCTSDLCDAAHGGCFHEPLPDGVECAEGKVCNAGSCL